MLSINWADVVNVLNSCKNYLIGFGVVLLLVIIALIAAAKLDKAKKFMVRAQAGIAALLALVVTVNLVCFGPLYTLISLATGSGSISEESVATATELCTAIGEEGIVLLENDGTLPLAPGNLNVFGWASTNPCYGGTGSGALSDSYPAVSLLKGLEDAGFAPNRLLHRLQGRPPRRGHDAAGLDPAGAQRVRLQRGAAVQRQSVFRHRAGGHHPRRRRGR